MISYNEILLILERFANNHKFNPRFYAEFAEQLPNLATEDIEFPVIFCNPVAGDTLENVDVTEVEIYCLDRLRKDRKNTNDVVSDTKQILSQDLTRWLEEGQQDLEIERTYPCQPYNNYLLDYTAGWSMRVRFQNERISICEVPVDDVTPEPVVCDPANYTVQYANGTLIESGTIPSGGTKTVTVPNCPEIDDATWTLTDTNGNTLDTGTIPSGGSATIVAPDATININGALWDTVPSGGVENISVRRENTAVEVGSKQGQYFRIADSTIQNSDASYSQDLAAEDSLTLPDSTVNVNAVDAGDVVSVKDVDINLTDSSGTVTPDSVTITGNTVDIVVSEPVIPTPIGAQVPKTGSTVSYVTGDDGGLQRGRDVDWLTLPANNPYGDTDRFKDELGGTAYANDIVIDWSTYNGSNTVLGYYRIPLTTASWATQVGNCAALSVGTFTSGWAMANWDEFENIHSKGTTLVAGRFDALNYTPFNINLGNYLWTSTSRDASFAIAYLLNPFGSFGVGLLNKTNSYQSIAAREFTVTGTTLS